MNPRQHHALVNPYSAFDHENVTKYRTIRQRGDGSMLVVILAVDR